MVVQVVQCKPLGAPFTQTGPVNDGLARVVRCTMLMVISSGNA